MKKFISSLMLAILMFNLCACSLTDLIFQKEDTSNLLLQADAELTLNAYELILYTGESYQLDGTSASGKILKWKSSNEKVALVNSNGLVTAVGVGIANISCYTNGGVEASCTITVKELVSAEPSVAPTTPTTSNTPAYTATSGFIFPHSSYAYLTMVEIHNTLSRMVGYSPSGSYSQDAINEIYARNGYIFKNEKIAAYYNSQSWYYPNPYFQEANLNEYEKANIALLNQYFE